MKISAIIRIILFSLAIFLLLGVLGLNLGVSTFAARFDREGTIGETPVRSDKGEAAGTADPAKICHIEIEWVAGSITIEPSESASQISITETGVTDEKYRMVCNQSGDTYSIRFCRESLSFPSFGFSGSSKDLKIQVPTDWFCDSLEIETASADVIIRDLQIGELDFDGASGNCTLENCTVSQLDVDVASGDLDFTGMLNALDFDGASADCTLVLSGCPDHISLDGMSGKLNITLPSDCGFTVNTDGLHCDFSTDFDTTSRGGIHSHGDGSCQIELDALSGSVVIHDGGYTCHDDGQNQHHQGHH